MLYSAYFNIKYPAHMVIEANSEHEANEVAQNLLTNMEDEELIARIYGAISVYGIEVVNIEEA